VFEKYFSISAISSLASRATSLAVALASHTNRTASLTVYTVSRASDAMSHGNLFLPSTLSLMFSV
jgi:hypothetical protein